MNIIDLLGIIGGTCVGLSFIPQTYKTIKTKKVQDLSKIFICINILSSTLMLIYGIYRLVIPIIIANGSVFINNIVLLCCVYIYNEN